jgi:hypothetical protein
MTPPTMSATSTVLDHSEQPQNAQAIKEKKLEFDLTDQSNLLPFRKVVVVFIGLALCLLVSCLDRTMVATALPSISAYFNAGSVSAWVPSGTYWPAFTPSHL